MYKAGSDHRKIYKTLIFLGFFYFLHLWIEGSARNNVKSFTIESTRNYKMSKHKNTYFSNYYEYKGVLIL